MSDLRGVNCDQVAWMLAAIERYLQKENEPRCGSRRSVLVYGLLYEIMDAASLVFADDSAAHNGTPTEVQLLRWKPERQSKNLAQASFGMQQGRADDE